MTTDSSSKVETKVENSDISPQKSFVLGLLTRNFLKKDSNNHHFKVNEYHIRLIQNFYPVKLEDGNLYISNSNIGKDLELGLELSENTINFKLYVQGYINTDYERYTLDTQSFSFDSLDNSANKKLLDISKTKGEVKDNKLIFTNHNIVDFLAFIFSENVSELIPYTCYSEYFNLINQQQYYPLTLKYYRKSKEAVPISKTRFTDSGYDLTLIRETERKGHTYIKYETDIIVEPPIGYYVDVVPRSSFSKSGHVLLNSVGIIDSTYNGGIGIVLAKVDEKVPDLQLPFKGFQIILRKMEFSHLKECDLSELVSTDRGTGGFGSTDKLNSKF